MKISSNIPGPLIRRLQRKWHTKFFVETGTAHGDTAELAAVLFDRVWSCDINAELVDSSQKRLADYPNVEITVESSPDFLHRIRPNLVQPVMYWLDAHWCGGPKPAKECLLLEELKAIAPLNRCSVILIDDIELMESPPPQPHDPTQWPTIAEVQSILDHYQDPYDLEYYQGVNSRILSITPKEDSNE